MTLKVLVTGAFSTGKTTLIRAIARSLLETQMSVAVLDDVARTCPYPLNEAQTDEASVWLATTQISLELGAAAKRPDVVLCDRGIPDILSHLHNQVQNSEHGWTEYTRFLSSKWISTYDVILLSRVDDAIPIKPDGMRSLDSSYRRDLDISAVSVLASRPDFVTLPHKLQERITQARDTITSALACSRKSAAR